MKEMSIRRRSRELSGVCFPGLPWESLSADKQRFEPRDKYLRKHKLTNKRMRVGGRKIWQLRSEADHKSFQDSAQTFWIPEIDIALIVLSPVVDFRN